MELCENLTQHKNISVFEDFSVKKFESNVTNWKINDEFQAGEVILCTGSCWIFSVIFPQKKKA